MRRASSVQDMESLGSKAKMAFRDRHASEGKGGGGGKGREGGGNRRSLRTLYRVPEHRVCDVYIFLPPVVVILLLSRLLMC